MATKIYLSGGAINLEGVYTDILSINPSAFDWQKNGNDFSVRDKIENQSYLLGVIGDIQDESGTPYADEAALLTALNSLVNHTISEVIDDSGQSIGATNPQPVAPINLVYNADIDSSNITGWTGVFENLLNGSPEGISNASVDSPKSFEVDFKLAITSYTLALVSGVNEFSNLRITGIFGVGNELILYDNSSDNTKKPFDIISLPDTLGFGGLRFEFFTADPIDITTLVIGKYSLGINIIRGEKPTGSFANVQLTDSGNFKTTDAENGLAIAKGDVIGTTFVHKFGNAPSFSTGDGVVSVWDAADGSGSAQYQYNYSATADIDSISSSNNTDMQDIQVQGLDVNYELITQSVTLVGQTPVLLSTPLIRVFRMKNVSSLDLLGNVFLYINGSVVVGGVPSNPANIRAGIETPNNQTLMALYTVPAGKTAYIRDWYAATAAGNKNSTYKIVLKARSFGGVFQTKHVSSISDTATNAYQHEYEEPEKFEEKTDIEMTAQLLSSGVSGASISAGFDIVLVDN